MFTFPTTFFASGGPRRVFTGLSGLGTGANTFNFTGMSFDTATADRMVVVGIMVGTTGTNFNINSVTVAGSGATLVVQQTADDTILKARSALYRVSLTTGTSGTVSVALGGSVSQCQVGIWSVYGLVSQTPNTTAGAGAIDGNSANFNINIPATGILLVPGHLFGAAGAQTLNNVSVVAPDGGTDGTNAERQWGSYQAGGPETPRNISMTGAGNVNSARTLVGATWA